MRTTIAISAAIATFAGSALAANCNPSYNVAPSTDCFLACNVKAGQSFVPGWTMDPTSEKFIPSLTVMCDKTSSNYGSFMATAGMCMIGCTGDDPELFNKEFAGACAWWATHKNDKCAAETTTTTTTTKTTTTTTKPVTTTTVSTTKPVTTAPATTTKATTTVPATTTTANPTGAATVTVTVTVNSCATTTPTSCTNYNTIFAKQSGWGVLGDCCETQWDCTGSCINGACDADHNPSKTCTVKKYFGKKNGKGTTGACCRTQRDCKNDCRGGECTKN